MRKTDFTYLTEIADGDFEVIREMIDLVIRETPRQLEKIKQANEREDWDALREAAHNIKPTLSYVGLEDLKQTAQHIEQKAANQQDRESIPGLIEKLEKGYREVTGELEAAKRELSHK